MSWCRVGAPLRGGDVVGLPGEEPPGVVMGEMLVGLSGVV